MKQYLAKIALLVKDYDEAILFYTKKLSFVLKEDTALSDTKRWVVISPPGSEGCDILLAKANNETQMRAVGNQSGGRVFLFLYTDNFYRDYNNMVKNNIEIVRPPTQEPHGMVCVFRDLYGNLWDFIEPQK